MPRMAPVPSATWCRDASTPSPVNNKTPESFAVPTQRVEVQRLSHVSALERASPSEMSQSPLLWFHATLMPFVGSDDPPTNPGACWEPLWTKDPVWEIDGRPKFREAVCPADTSSSISGATERMEDILQASLPPAPVFLVAERQSKWFFFSEGLILSFTKTKKQPLEFWGKFPSSAGMFSLRAAVWVRFSSLSFVVACN